MSYPVLGQILFRVGLYTHNSFEEFGSWTNYALTDLKLEVYTYSNAKVVTLRSYFRKQI